MDADGPAKCVVGSRVGCWLSPGLGWLFYWLSPEFNWLLPLLLSRIGMTVPLVVSRVELAVTIASLQDWARHSHWLVITMVRLAIPKVS